MVLSSQRGRWAALAEATAFALDIHASQTRKGTDIPYISHLLGVCGLVLKFGGDEEQAIAALLRDAIEDQGAEPPESDCCDRFRIPFGCSRIIGSYLRNA